MDKYAEGKAVGKAEGKDMRSAEIALNMLKANKPIDEINQFTGLSQDAIAKLKSEL